MNYLFVDIAQWQLPEWLSAGTASAMLGNIITLVVLIIKQRANRILANNLSERQISLLDTMVNKLSDSKNISNQLDEMNTSIIKLLASLEKGWKDQEMSNVNLALFLNECFQLSNLSDENKLTLKVKCEELFYNNNSSVIETLKSLQLTTEQLLMAKKAEVENLKNEVEKGKELLRNHQKPIKKTRRI